MHKRLVPIHNKIHQKIKAAEANLKKLKKAKTPLAFALAGTVDQSAASPSEFGGFGLWDHRLMHVLHMDSKNPAECEKSLNYWWPKDLITGKPMAYLGCITTMGYLDVIIQLTLQRQDQWTTNSPFHGASDTNARGRYTTIHFWVGDPTRRKDGVPNCFVAYSDESIDHFAPYEGPCETLYKEWAEKYRTIPKNTRTLIQNRIDEFALKTLDVNPPSGAFENLHFFCNPDPLPKKNGDTVYFDYEDKKESILFPEYSNDFQLFGCPRSQQEPHRPIATRRWPYPHALMPYISFNDAVHDVTHQIYGPAFLRPIQTEGYGYMDSSNT